MGSAAEFSLGLDKWIGEAQERAEQRVKQLALEALEGIIEKTPVDTGFLRANWTVIINGAAPGTIKTPKRGESDSGVGGAAIAGAARILSFKLGDTITIANPVEYARRIEHGFNGTDSLGRTYNQRGRHMVRLTLEELRTKYGL